MGAIQEWEREVAKLRAKGLQGAEILEQLAASQPDLHQRYLREWNEKHAQRAAGKPL